MGIGKPFESGNTFGKGRPLGSSNKKTIFQEALEKDGEAIIQKIKQRALKADPVAMRLCMERLVPLAKEPNARFRLPVVERAADLTEGISAVTEAVAEGELSAHEGESVARIVESQRRNIEVEEFDARLRALEETSKHGPEEA
jgi:AcrR family transcriptional regulator